MTTERIQKVLARAGVASRRAVEELLVQGRITVNGVTTKRLGTQVDPSRDRVEVDGQRIRLAPKRAVVVAVHKPAAMLTTLSDPQGRPTIGDLVEGVGRRVFPVGRLDWDAEGLVLMTDDGELAHRLQHPRFRVPRTYRAKVRGDVTPATLRSLIEGVRLDDGPARASRARVVSRGTRNSWLEITLHEGRNHLVKRMLDKVGHPVLRLKRTSHGGIELGDLPPGRWQRLTAEEIARLEEGVEPEEIERRAARAASDRKRALDATRSAALPKRQREGRGALPARSTKRPRRRRR